MTRNQVIATGLAEPGTIVYAKVPRSAQPRQFRIKQICGDFGGSYDAVFLDKVDLQPEELFTDLFGPNYYTNGVRMTKLWLEGGSINDTLADRLNSKLPA